MPNRVYPTVSKANGTASVACVSYPSTTGWKTVTLTDGSVSAGATLAATGAMTWTQPTDAVPRYMFGMNGFWVKLSFSVALDSEVEISSCTYGSGWTAVQDVWDGASVDAIEAQRYKNVTGAYYVYGTSAISLGGMTSSDYLYFNTPDPIIAMAVDVGATPNITGTTAINSFQYLTPAGTWTGVGTFTDGSSGLSKNGYVTFGRQSDIVPMQWNGLAYNSYWYRFTVDKTLSSSTNIGIQVIPYYDISKFGIGVCNAVWKDKVVYTFDQDPSYLYITPQNSTQSLSSSNASIFQVGDGRANKVLAMKQFYNELLTGQEEKGDAGGCITLLQGTEPENLGKIVLSSYYGVMNSQCMEVVDTVEGGSNAFILSKRGIMTTDGRSVNFVKNFWKVKNYFDPSNADCIRAGYESKMYLKHDSSYNILKIGLVSGSSATNVNVTLVYDLITNEFGKDSYANGLACECEVEAGSGNVPMIQLGGGQGDGTIYVLNTGADDLSTAVSSYVDVVLNYNGLIRRVYDFLIRNSTQSAGSMTITPYFKGVVQSDVAKTLALTAESANEVVRRHRFNVNWVESTMYFRVAHSATGESFYILDWGCLDEEYTEQ
jgi:hypothetical protein